MSEHAAILERAQAAVERSATIDDALLALAETLPEEMDITRIGIRQLDADAEVVRVVAVWSHPPTLLVAGRTHQAAGELYDVTFADVAQSGTSKVVRLGAADPPHLFEILLAEEGHRSAVGIPLPGADTPTVLALLSGKADVFEPDDLPFLDQLGATVGDQLLGLLEDSA